MSSPPTRPPSETASGGDSPWLLARAFEHLPAAIWTVDRKLHITSMRGGLLREMEVREEEVLGTHLFDLIADAKSDDDVPAAYRNTLEGEPQRFEVRWGSRAWQVHLEPIRTTSDEVTGVLGVALDVTAQVETARRLEEERAHLRQLFEEAPGGVVLVNKEDRILEVNRGFERIFGFTRSEAMGQRVNELITPPGREGEASSLSERVLDGERVDAEAVRVRKDGSEVHVAIMGTPVDLGEQRTAYAIYRDITQQKELEAQLLHSQRLEAVGQLAGGVAHDFNNALTVILGHVEALADEVREEELQEELRQLETAANHAARLTKGLLTFSRRDVVSPARVHVDEVVTETRELLGRSFPDNVELATELAEELPPVEADPNQLQQMLVNLVLNAWDAMPDGGRVTLRTSGEGDHVLLEVEDTGHGMSPEETARAFEPYFTTKPQGQGSGLGLSVVYGIVERAGGSIAVSSEPGQGAAFRISLPAVAPESEEDAPPAGDPGTGARILLVDDEGPTLRAARSILEEAGHRVLASSSGTDALDQMDSSGEPPDLVLVDLSLPGMGGPRLAEELRRRWPEVRVIFTAGYNEADWAQRLDKARLSGHDFIPKPFDGHTLARKVREVLIHG